MTYSAAFFDRHKDISFLSASVVIPHVISLCHPQSVADFGCGAGTWIRALLDLGVSDVTGIDGDYIPDESLVIPPDRLVRVDIGEPLDLKRRFDLAVSVEVAEHLPQEKASVFVETLTRHSDIVLFSAAVPKQGGTHHVNEQWPGYWNSLFSSHGYTCVDCLRDVFWDDERIAWWYRQNMFLYVASGLLPTFPKLLAESNRAKKLPLAMIHPGFIRRQISFRELLQQIPGPLRATLSQRWQSLTGRKPKISPRDL